MTDGPVTDCICGIIAGRAPADVVARDGEFGAFRAPDGAGVPAGGAAPA
jgi:hypothetical protein